MIPDVVETVHEEPPTEGQHSRNIGIVIASVCGTMLLLIIISDVPTLHRQCLYMRDLE